MPSCNQKFVTPRFSSSPSEKGTDFIVQSENDHHNPGIETSEVTDESKSDMSDKTHLSTSLLITLS